MGNRKGFVPPHSPEAESGVLGAILIHAPAFDEAAEILIADDFYSDAHRSIFGAMAGLSAKDSPIDLVTLAEALKGGGKLDQIGGPAYLARLSDMVPSSANVGPHAEIVKDHALARRLIEASFETIAKAQAPGVNADEAAQEAQAAIFALLAGRKAQTIRPFSELVSEYLHDVEERFKNKTPVVGLRTGLKDLDDKKLHGLQKTDLIIVAARPGMGKTSLALNISATVAADSIPVLFFSLEMSKDQLTSRLVTAEARVSATRAKTGFLGEGDLDKLTQAAMKVADWPILIDDTGAQDIGTMRAIARRQTALHGVGLVVVDYIQLAKCSASASQGRYQEVTDISAQLKAMAKELDIPVIALSQLNRKCDERPNKRPVMSDLRESGSIEQDADVIVFVYRDSAYNDLADPCLAELIVSKQRNGAPGTVMVRWDGQFTKFDNLAEKTFCENQ